MKHLIKKLLREGLLDEEYNAGKLYGYHCTSRGNLESIFKNGFNVGNRSMQGKGVYSFYNLKDATGYASKGEISDPVIVKYYLSSKYSVFILNMNIAKEILGSEYTLKNQINKKWWGDSKGIDGFLDIVKLSYKRDITMTELISVLDNIEKNNSEGNQRTFWASLIPKKINDNLNIVLDGYYGTEIRINNPSLMIPVGYYDIDSTNGTISQLNNKVMDKYQIPDNSEYDELRKIKNSSYGDNLDLISLKVKLYDDMLNVRNNRAYEQLEKLIDQIRKITGTY